MAQGKDSLRDTATKEPRRDVDVITVAHNAGALLSECTLSACFQAGAENVWIVDAESSDGSVEAACRACGGEGLHVLSAPNAGFAASNNRAIEVTESQYVFLLNPDAVLCPRALATLIATAEKHPSCGIVGPRILNPDGTFQDNAFGKYPTLVRTLFLHVRRAIARLKSKANGVRAGLEPTQVVPVDWVTGAAMLVRRDAIVQCGMMDEGFFLYFEDIEWCHRMRDHGWEILLEPDAQVIHYLGRSDVPSEFVAHAYRESFYRYCDLYGLWGLKTFARLGLLIRQLIKGGA